MRKPAACTDGFYWCSGEKRREERSSSSESVDPLGFEGSRVFGLIQSGRYEEVIREYLDTGHGNRSPLIYQLLATAFEVQGRHEEAIEATVDALTRCNEFARAASIRAIWESGGYQKVLQWYLQDLQARSRT